MAALDGSPALLLGGFLFFPWTTLIYGFVAPNGLTLLNIIFLIAAFAIDLGTWGIGFFASQGAGLVLPGDVAGRCPLPPHWRPAAAASRPASRSGTTSASSCSSSWRRS